MSDEDETQVHCPVPGCVDGKIVTRTERGDGYSVISRRCSYCYGTGSVTPARAQAYLEQQE